MTRQEICQWLSKETLEYHGATSWVCGLVISKPLKYLHHQIDQQDWDDETKKLAHQLATEW